MDTQKIRKHIVIKRKKHDEIIMPHFALPRFYVPCYRLVETLKATGLLYHMTPAGSLATLMYGLHMDSHGEIKESI